MLGRLLCEGQRTSAVEELGEALGGGGAGCGVLFLGFLIIMLALRIDLAAIGIRRTKVGSLC